jgi:hypothetical protein
MKKLGLFICFIMILWLPIYATQAEPMNLREVNLEDLQEVLKVGLTKKEVKRLLGQPDGILQENSLKDVPDNPEYWRYDIPTDGYSFNPKSPDYIDLEGLENGDMRMQIRLSWSSDIFNQKVSSFGIFYKYEGSIYWYDDSGGFSVYNADEEKFMEKIE